MDPVSGGNLYGKTPKNRKREVLNACPQTPDCTRARCENRIALGLTLLLALAACSKMPKPPLNALKHDAAKPHAHETFHDRCASEHRWSGCHATTSAAEFEVRPMAMCRLPLPDGPAKNGERRSAEFLLDEPNVGAPG